MTTSTRRPRTRLWHTLGLLAVVGGTSYVAWPEAQPQSPVPLSQEGETISIAAFNIQVFGRTKASKPDVMDQLARAVRQFDLVVVQEIRESAMNVAVDFLARINQEPGVDYLMHEGPRLGRTSSKEQYAVYYKPSITLLEASTYPDPEDLFEREPLVASFRAGQFDFTLVACHIKPDDASAELTHLAGAAAALLSSNPDEQDIILLGDFNADGDYFDEDDLTHALRDTTYHWVIDNDMDTMVRTNWTYDRIILLAGTYYSEFVEESGAVFYFDQEFGLTDQDFIEDISDHFPVYAIFRIGGPDDDGIPN